MVDDQGQINITIAAALYAEWSDCTFPQTWPLIYARLVVSGLLNNALQECRQCDQL